MLNECKQATMRAIQINEYNDANVIEISQAPRPTLASNDVLIEVHSAALNPTDWKTHKGYLNEMLHYKFPLTLGWDVAGVIIEVGESVTDWSIGDEVYSRPKIGGDGAFAEYVAVDAREIALKPTTLDWNHTAAVPLAALTAWQAMYDFADVKAGERVLIQSGSGGVCSFAIQLAKLRGAYVISTCSTGNIEFVKSLGADKIIDYTQQDFSELRDIDVLFDTLGGEALTKSWQTLKRGARLVSIIDAPDETIANQHGVTCSAIFVQPSHKQLQALANLIDEGKLIVALDSVYPFEEAAIALVKSESNRVKGKVVLQVL